MYRATKFFSSATSGRNAILALAIMAALILTATRVFVLWQSRSAMIEDAEGATQDWAVAVEDYAKRTLTISDLLIDQVAERIRRAGGLEAIRSSREFHDYLRELAQRSLSFGLLVVDRSGRPVSVTTAFPAPQVDLSDRTWFKMHMDQRAVRYIGEALHSRLSDRVLFTYSRPMISSTGDFEAIIQVSIGTDFFQQVTQSSGLGPEASVSLWKLSGELMARTNISAQQANEKPRSEELANRASYAMWGTFRSSSLIDQVDRVISFRVVEGWPVVATAGMPVDAILRPWRRELVTSTLLLTSALGMIALLAFFAMRASRRERLATQGLAAANAEITSALVNKDLLLREIHHRVKNNLQMVASLLRLRFRKVADPQIRELLSDVELRMRSLAMLHESLYGQDVAQVFPASRYLSRIIEDCARSLGFERRDVSVSFDGEPVEISLDQAIPLGLLVTEVLSNAAKHAFVDRKGGAIGITLRRDGTGAVLRIADDGVGLSEEAGKAGSLGFQLLKAFAAQLSGRYSLEVDGGTVFEMFFPLTSPAQAPKAVAS